MRLSPGVLTSLFLAGGFGFVLALGASRADETKTGFSYEPEGDIQPVQEDRPIARPTQDPRLAAELAGGRQAEDLFGNIGGRLPAAPAARQEDVRTVSASGVSGVEAQTRSATNVADLVGKSTSLTGVETQKRTPVVQDARVRGYHVGQLLTQLDGGYFFPARQDLDTALSKIDAGTIRDLIVIKGPYSARYGPGFSFFDIETLDTFRSKNGFEAHGRTTMNYQTNGEQIYARESIWGGAENWGFRLGYGHRTGNDYETGNDVLMPSSYKIRDIDFALGADLTEDSRLEIKGLRLDETDVEFPGILLDLNFLVTDGYVVRYTLEDQPWFDRLVVDGFYNRTRFEADNLRSGKRRQVPQLNDLFEGEGAGILALRFDAVSDVDQLSTGYRTAVTWGKSGEPQLTLGSDLRFNKQELNEFDTFTFISPVPGLISGIIPFVNEPQTFNFPIPRSHATNPGVYLELSVPVHEQLFVKGGGRLDYVGTEIDETPAGFDTATMASESFYNTDGTDFDRDFTLGAVYATAEYKCSPHLTFLGGVGAAQRPPTLTELYALQPFLGILQNGLSFVQGDPDLDPESLWQVDVGLRYESERFRGGANGFYAFVRDYITFELVGLNITPVVLNQTGLGDLTGFLTFDQKGLRFVNTDLATLSGGEVYGEFDWNEYLTPFMSLSYVEGRDHTRDDRVTVFPVSSEEPLPLISPLETRVGVRVHEGVRNPRWSIEFTARIVDNQDRFADSLRELATPGFTTYDLRSYWRVSRNFLLTAGIENLTDKNFREHLDLRTGTSVANPNGGVFQPGRNYYFGFEWNY